MLKEDPIQPGLARGARVRDWLFVVCVVLIVGLYGAGLTREIDEPWVGMHDWNGAFYSQLARNLLRYPLSVHHGVPLVGVGEAVPPAAERSLYSTHPPGLVWLLLPGFGVLGDAEWVARLVPIVFSLGSLVLLMVLVARIRGRETAVIGGLAYALMPMSVYFGRMVDQEAICLFFMLASLGAWRIVVDRAASPRRRRVGMCLWLVAIGAGIWVDWPGALFGGLFCLHVLVAWRRGLLRSRPALVAIGGVASAIVSVVVYLVYAGLGGHWGSLLAIFGSRAGSSGSGEILKDGAARGGVWDYTIQNLTWPILVLSICGIVWAVVRLLRNRGDATPATAVAHRHVRNGSKWILPLTGVVWVLVFPQQYERHNYWLFYLGPVAAVLTGYTLVQIRNRLRRVGRRFANVVLACAVLILIHFSESGLGDYYSRLSYPPQEVEAWRGVRAMTDMGDTVLVFRNPVREEMRGKYRFRNIIPPQFAYYLDRSFAVESDIEAVAGHSDVCVLFTLPVRDAIARQAALHQLERQFRAEQVGSEVVFVLREAVTEMATE